MQKKKKKWHANYIINHDASVMTMLKREEQKGFVLVTWDGVMINLVEALARIYADTPARVIDLLSMAAGVDFECEQNYEMFTALLHADERVAGALARKIEQIRSVDQAYKFDVFIQEARNRNGPAWVLRPEDISPFIDSEEEDGGIIGTAAAGNLAGSGTRSEAWSLEGEA